jgi:hypothetical protein
LLQQLIILHVRELDLSRLARLDLDPCTDACVVRRHVRYIDGNPAIISDDYFIPTSLHPGADEAAGSSSRTQIRARLGSNDPGAAR